MNESPFAVAREQGVNIDYYDLGDKVVAIYADLSGYQIILNSLMDNDRKEDAVHVLLKHHNSEMKGVIKVIHKNNAASAFAEKLLVKGIEKLNKTFLSAMLIHRSEEA